MKTVNVVAKNMARNGLKIANALGCAFHFESEFMSLIKNIEVRCQMLSEAAFLY